MIAQVRKYCMCAFHATYWNVIEKGKKKRRNVTVIMALSNTINFSCMKRIIHGTERHRYSTVKIAESELLISVLPV